VSEGTTRLSISLSLVVDSLEAIYIKGTRKLVFNFIFYCLWTGRSSSVSSVAFLGSMSLNRLRSMVLEELNPFTVRR